MSCIYVICVEYRLANSFCENLQLEHHCIICLKYSLGVACRPNMTVMLVILWLFALLRCALGWWWWHDVHKLIFLQHASCCSMYGGSVGYGLGWVSYLVGWVGSMKIDPRTTLQHPHPKPNRASSLVRFVTRPNSDSQLGGPNSDSWLRYWSLSSLAPGSTNPILVLLIFDTPTFTTMLRQKCGRVTETGSPYMYIIFIYRTCNNEITDNEE